MRDYRVPLPLMCAVVLGWDAAQANAGDLSLAEIRIPVRTAFANGGWKYDRHKELASPRDRAKTLLRSSIRRKPAGQATTQPR